MYLPVCQCVSVQCVCVYQHERKKKKERKISRNREKKKKSSAGCQSSSSAVFSEKKYRNINKSIEINRIEGGDDGYVIEDVMMKESKSTTTTKRS